MTQHPLNYAICPTNSTGSNCTTDSPVRQTVAVWLFDLQAIHYSDMIIEEHMIDAVSREQVDHVILPRCIIETKNRRLKV